MKPLKYIVLLMVCGLLSTSCDPCKRLWRLCPPVPITEIDTIVEVEYKDTTIYVEILGEIIIDSVPYEIPGLPIEVPLPYAEIEAHSSLAYAKAYILNNHLNLRLVQLDSVLAFKLDSVRQVTLSTITIEDTIIPPAEKFVPTFYKVMMYGFFAAIASFLMLFFLRKR